MEKWRKNKKLRKLFKNTEFKTIKDYKRCVKQLSTLYSRTGMRYCDLIRYTNKLRCEFHDWIMWFLMCDDAYDHYGLELDGNIGIKIFGWYDDLDYRYEEEFFYTR